MVRHGKTKLNVQKGKGKKTKIRSDTLKYYRMWKLNHFFLFYVEFLGNKKKEMNFNKSNHFSMNRSINIYQKRKHFPDAMGAY
jgi:hypothetical protein